jgi:hypothetical protein
MINKVFSFGAALLAANFIIMLIEALSVYLFPLYPDSSLNDIVKIEQYTQKTGTHAMLIVLLAYVIGSFTGGLVLRLLSKEFNKFIAIRLGLVLMFLGLFNLLSFSHPVWFWITSLTSYVPFTLIGYNLFKLKPILNP